MEFPYVTDGSEYVLLAFRIGSTVFGSRTSLQGVGSRIEVS